MSRDFNDFNEALKLDKEAMSKIQEITGKKLKEKILKPYDISKIKFNKEKNSLILITETRDDINYVISLQRVLQELDPNRELYLIIIMDVFPFNVLQFILQLNTRVYLFSNKYNELKEYFSSTANMGDLGTDRKDINDDIVGTNLILKNLSDLNNDTMGKSLEIKINIKENQNG